MSKDEWQRGIPGHRPIVAHPVQASANQLAPLQPACSNPYHLRIQKANLAVISNNSKKCNFNDWQRKSETTVIIVAASVSSSSSFLFHQAFVQCVRTGSGALTGQWLRDGVAWLTFWLRRCAHAVANWFLAAFSDTTDQVHRPCAHHS